MRTSSQLKKVTYRSTQPAVLCAAALVVLGLILLTAYQRFSTPQPFPVAAQPPAFDAQFDTELDNSDIVRMNLFGAPQALDATNPSEDQNPDDIPQTNLRLALKGTFTHSVEKKASALIAPDINSKAKLFFIDQQLPGDAVLEEVHASFVLIRRNGQREKLEFLRNQPNQSSAYSDLSYEQYTPPSRLQNRSVAPNMKAPSQGSENSLDNSAGNNASSPNSLADIQKILLEKRQQLRQQQQ